MGELAPWKVKVDLFRRRFKAREDVFSIKTISNEEEIDAVTGEVRVVERAYFMPQCKNHMRSDICRLAKRTGGCTGCEHKAYQELSDEWIWKHVKGDKQLVLYLLTKQGIKFGVCDFDQCDPFEDALATRNTSLAYGVPCHIARSSKKGYHVYWFFTDWVDPDQFSSFVRAIYLKNGFYQRTLESGNTISLPEVFPKQTKLLDNDQLGNAIAIPMIEPRMQGGFNCWVDDQATPIAFDSQWSHFEQLQEVTPELLYQKIQEHKIEVIEGPVGRGSSSPRTGGGHTNTTPNDSRELIQKGRRFAKIIDHCPAMRMLWEKLPDGRFKWDVEKGKVFHEGRVASMEFAINTEDGVKMLLERWPTDKTQAMIDHGLQRKYYSPTCKTLQEKGVCAVGVHPRNQDHCIKKQPERRKIDGRLVVNPDQLPEDQWPEPSPYRFSFETFMTFEEIMAELEKLFTPPPTPEAPTTPELDAHGKPIKKKKETFRPDENEVRRLIRVGKRLTPTEQKKIEDFIKVNKAIPTREYNKIKKEVEREILEEKVQAKREVTRNFKWQKAEYFLEKDGYVRVQTDFKGNKEEIKITNFTIEVIQEIETYETLEDETDSKKDRDIRERHYVCTLNYPGGKSTFRVQADKWMKTADSFFSLLTIYGGANLMYKRCDFDDIRTCINQFSKDGRITKQRIVDIGHHIHKGEHFYLMPSVIVTKDGIQKNEEFEAGFSDEFSKNLDFRLISDEEFRKLSLHLINDYFGCNSHLSTMTTFGQSVCACIMSHVPLKKSPILWLNGAMASGKTFVAEAAQWFYGTFDTGASSASTGKGKLEVAHNFRNALLLVDDFKSALESQNSRDMISFIQQAYDRSGRATAKREGGVRERSSKVRGLIAVTGEDMVFQEASALSRLLLVAINKRMTAENEVCGGRMREYQQLYRGFMPHVLHYVYNMPEGSVGKIYKEYFDLMDQAMRKDYGKDNTRRISENLAFNMTGFRIGMDTMVQKGAIVAEQRDALCAQHMRNLGILRMTVTSHVIAQKGSTVFIEAIKELLQDSQKYYIQGWPGHHLHEGRRGDCLGIYRYNDPGVINLHPQVAYAAVKLLLDRNKSYPQTPNHVGMMLAHDGHMPETGYDLDRGIFKKQIRSSMGRIYVWQIKLSSLGLDPPPPNPSQARQEEMDDGHGAEVPSAQEELTPDVAGW